MYINISKQNIRVQFEPKSLFSSNAMIYDLRLRLTIPIKAKIVLLQEQLFGQLRHPSLCQKLAAAQILFLKKKHL